MTQVVKFPDDVFGRLATIAEQRHVRIADLIVEAAEHLLAPSSTGPSTHEANPAKPEPVYDLTTTSGREEAITDLNGIGMNDREIAENLGLPRSTVMYYRRERLDLPKVTASGRPRKGVTA